MVGGAHEGYQVRLAGSARRDLRSVPPKMASAIVEFVFGDLARSPSRVGKPLERDLDGLWGARRGPYRIIYEIRGDPPVVLVIHVDHRADVYRPR